MNYAIQSKISTGQIFHPTDTLALEEIYSEIEFHQRILCYCRHYNFNHKHRTKFEEKNFTHEHWVKKNENLWLYGNKDAYHKYQN